MDAKTAERLVLACIEHVEPRSVGIFIVGSDDNPRDPGSGTLFKVGGRYLVATAAHVVKDEALGAIGVGVFNRPDRRTPKLVGYGFRGGGPSDPVDVAWLEIDPRAVPEMHKCFLSLDSVRPGVPHAEDEVAFVLGYPHEKFDVGTHEGRWLIRTQGVGFGTATLGAATIPNRYSAHYDTYVAWPEGEVSPGSPDGWLKALPSAPGMSGCGMWLVMHRDGAIWVPDKMRMVAIQHSWHEGERWLRGTQVQHWLRMVAEDLPDLRAEIAASFPNLLAGQPA